MRIGTIIWSSKEFYDARVDSVQLDVRSAFAHERVHALTKLTGMTASEVVEDALPGYGRLVCLAITASSSGAGRC